MNTATTEAPAIRQILVNQILPSPHQARKDFDEEGLKALAESMRLEGLMQPVVVRPVPSPLPSPARGEGEMTYFELISGERRLRAAKLLGWETIEAKVIET